MSEQIRITYYRSAIGSNYRHKRIIRSLGLKRLNHSRIVQASGSMMGMLRKVPHLVRVEMLNDVVEKTDTIPPENVAENLETSSQMTDSGDIGAQTESDVEQDSQDAGSAEQNDAETAKDD